MHDLISLSAPCKPEFVSVVRLTVSGVANRIGFDYDSIEDIKVAVSEVCNKIIEKLNEENHYTIDCLVFDDKIEIGIKPDHGELELFGEEDELAFEIISALMDEVEMSKNKEYLIKLTKKFERIC